MRPSGSVTRALVAALLAGAVTGAEPLSAQLPASPAAADSAYAAGDAARAERLYALVLAERPGEARAAYRLGQLRLARDPAEAARLFRRYAELQPQDAWGWMALGDALSRAGRDADAQTAYDRAAALAPGERDVAVGRARALARAGRAAQAAAEYERWLAGAPRDAEAWRELGELRQRSGALRESVDAYERSLALQPHEPTRRRLARARALLRPALEPWVALARDSDANAVLRVRLAADASVARGRLGLSASQGTVRDGAGLSLAVRELALTGEQSPHASLRLEGSAGVAVVGDTLTTGARVAEPVGSLRARWRPAARGPLLEGRATRQVLDATAALVLNRVVRTEGLVRAEVPVAGPLRLRGSGRVAWLDAAADRNTRSAVAAGLAVRATPLIDVALETQRVTFDHASTSGYFAPRDVRVVELGAYSERELANGVVLALDAGAGVQRVTLFAERAPGPVAALALPTGAPGQGPGAPTVPAPPPSPAPAPGRPLLGEPSTGWDPALRLWAQLVVPLRPGSQVRLELDTYDARSAEAAAATGWRYVSLSAGVRVGF